LTGQKTGLYLGKSKKGEGICGKAIPSGYHRFIQGQIKRPYAGVLRLTYALREE
jgi:hypothetical protein